MARCEFGDGLAPEPTGILPLVPFGRADLGKKTLHRCVVVEHFAIQVARIPVDQHTPEIEDSYIDCGRPRPRSRMTAPLPNLSPMDHTIFHDFLLLANA